MKDLGQDRIINTIEGLRVVLIVMVVLGIGLLLPTGADAAEKIVFTSNLYGQHNIYMINPDGTGLKRLTTGTAEELQPRISPDGKKIAFLRRDGVTCDIWLMNTDGTNQARLTNRANHPDINEKGVNNFWWYPDSLTIIMDVGYSTTEQKIYDVNVETGFSTFLLNNPDDKDMEPVVNPLNPAEFFFMYDMGNWTPDRVIRKFDGTSQSVIVTNDSKSRGNLAISHDGAKLAFNRSDSGITGNHQVIVVNSDGTFLTPLTSSTGNNPLSARIDNFYPSFSPDDTRIVFSNNQDGSYDLFSMPSVGGSAQRITTLPGDERYPFWGNVNDAEGVIQLAQTGQTMCYDSYGTPMGCSGTGQDADKMRGVVWPSPRYLYNGDGTLTDKLTGLVWLRNAECNGMMSWATAIGWARNLANGACGLTDGSAAGQWRLPNINEMQSLVNAELTTDNATWLNSQGFTNVAAYIYWSSTSVAPGLTSAWSFDMSNGWGSESDKIPPSFYAMAVRSGQSGTSNPLYPANQWKTGQTTSSVIGDDGNLQSGVAWPSPRFTDNNNGTVTDSLTGLIWLKNANCYGAQMWGTALSSANNLANGACGLTDGSTPGQWRLPNREELYSLLDYGFYNPALSNLAGNGQWTSGNPFLSPAGSYWSSTSAGASAWYVAMVNGSVSTISKTADSYVWPVRSAGAFGSPAISVSPSLIDFGPVEQGSLLAVQHFVITNTGTNNIYINDVTLSGDVTEFSILLNNCSNATLVPSGLCVVQVRFSPTATGLKNATLSVSSNAPTSPTIVSLTGSGLMMPYTLTVNKTGTGMGTVTSGPPGINCGADCSADYASGTVVTLTAMPDGGSTFTGWSGEGCIGTGICTVTMDMARNVNAMFEIGLQFNLTVTKTGLGTGNVTANTGMINWTGNTGTASYGSGTVVTLTAMPDAGSTFMGWSGEGCIGTGTCIVTMDMARNVTAMFDVISGAGVFPVATSPAGPGDQGRAGREMTSSAAFDGTNYLVGIQGDASLHDNITAQLVSQSGTLTGPRITVAGHTGGAPDVIFDGTRYLMVWQDCGDYTVPSCKDDLWGQFVNKAGSITESPFAITPDTVATHSATANGGGSYLVVYVKPDNIVYGRIVSQAGIVGNEIRISSGYGHQGLRNVAFDGSNFFVVWIDQTNNYEVRGRFVSPSGILGQEISINASIYPSDNPVSVAFGDNNYLVLWNDEMLAGQWDIFGQLIDKTGNKVGGAIGISSAPGPQLFPRGAFDGVNYLVTWTDMRNDSNWNALCDIAEGTCLDINGQFISATGVPVGTEFQVDADFGNQFLSSVVYGGGKYLAVWTNGDSIDGNTGDVYGKFIDILVNQMLTITKSGTGTGNVTANTGPISWTGNTGTASYANGTMVTLTAVPVAGSNFTVWFGCDSVMGDQCTVTMDMAKNVTAEFVLATLEADLSITQTDSPDPVLAGGNVTYTITVVNNGPADAMGVMLSDTLPVGVTYVSGTGAGWWCNESGGIVSCNKPVLVSAESSDVTVVVTAPVIPAILTNNIGISSAVSDPDAGNNSATATTTVNSSGGAININFVDYMPLNRTNALVYTTTIGEPGDIGKTYMRRHLGTELIHGVTTEKYGVDPDAAMNDADNPNRFVNVINNGAIFSMWGNDELTLDQPLTYGTIRDGDVLTFPALGFTGRADQTTGSVTPSPQLADIRDVIVSGTLYQNALILFGMDPAFPAAPVNFGANTLGLPPSYFPNANSPLPGAFTDFEIYALGLGKIADGDIDAATGNFGALIELIEVLANPLEGTWGNVLLRHDNSGEWNARGGKFTFNFDGSGSEDYLNNFNGTLSNGTEMFTYVVTPNSDGSLTVVFTYPGRTDTRRYALSDDGKHLIMDGTQDTSRQRFRVFGRMSSNGYTNADLSGDYVFVGYEHNANPVAPPNGNGAYMAISSVGTFDGTGNYTYYGRANSDGNMWDDSGNLRGYSVRPDGFFSFCGAAPCTTPESAGISDDRKSLLLTSPDASQWVSYIGLKKGDRPYSTADLEGTWAFSAFGDDNNTVFQANFGTMTCDAAGSCLLSKRDLDGSTVGYSTMPLMFSVAPDGSFGTSLGVTYPPYAAAIGSDGSQIIMNVSLGPDPQGNPYNNNRGIAVGVRCSNCVNIEGIQNVLTVTKTGAGSGNVTSDKGTINWNGNTGTAPYGSGAVVTLTATAGPGSSFAGWSGDADCFDGQVTMDAAVNCTATFAMDTTAPTGTIIINSDAASTSSTAVSLNLTCSDNVGCYQMQFSNDNLNWSTAETYSTTRAWGLTSGNGTKTVYVKFLDRGGYWSVSSDTIELVSAGGDVTPPNAVTGLTVSDTPNDQGGSIDLNWSGYAYPTDCAKYRVYRSTSSFSNVTGMTPVAEITPKTTRQYTDTSAVTNQNYYYAVTAVDATGNENNTVNTFGPVAALDNIAPSQITTLTAVDTPSDNGGSIKLDWTYTPPSDFGRYNIYRSTASFTSVSGMTAIATITNSSTSTYADTTVTNGTAYYYAITASDSSGNENKTVTATGPVSSKENTAPVLTIDSLVPTTLGQGQASTLTWHSDENCTYAVEVGGSGQNSGVPLASGSCTANTPINTVIDCKALEFTNNSPTVNHINIYVADAAGNKSSATGDITLTASCKVAYLINGSVTPDPGGLNADFTFGVDYEDAGAIAPPVLAWVFIKTGGNTEVSPLTSTTGGNTGRFEYTTSLTSGGTYQHYYVVVTANGAYLRYPSTDYISGPTVNKGDASLTCEVLPATVKLGYSVKLQGTLKKQDGSAMTIAGGDTIGIKLTDPDNNEVVMSPEIPASTGDYTATIDYFTLTKTGDWSVEASFPGNSTYNAKTCSTTVTVGKAAMLIKDFSVSPGSVLEGDTVSISARFEPSPNVGTDLSGLRAKLMITKPDKTSGVPVEICPEQTCTGHVTADGSLRLDNYAGFDTEGLWKVYVSFDEDTKYLATQTSQLPVQVLKSVGYAVIVQGRHSIQGQYEGLKDHNKTTNNVYKALIKRGFIDDNIFYFNYDTTQDGVDKEPSKADISALLSGTAIFDKNNNPFDLAQKMADIPGPLYVIFVDHGDPDKFYVDPDTAISPTEVSGWFDSLEASLAATPAANEKIYFVYGACYSGSFMKVSKGKSKRVVITSADYNELSRRGPKEPNANATDPRDGEQFVTELFRNLGSGKTLKEAFEAATKQIEDSPGGAPTNSSRYHDKSSQHPLLDDSGDGVGANELNTASGDGSFVNNIYLGYSHNEGSDAEVLSVSSAITLGTSENAPSMLWASVNDYSRVGDIWTEIKAPDFAPAVVDGQLIVDLPKCPAGAYNASQQRYEWTTYCSYDFSTPGLHEVFYYVRDNITGNISSFMKTLVYKELSGNQSPSAFDLAMPADGSQNEPTMPVLSWAASNDPDSDAVTYTVLISTDSSFTTVDYRLDSITSTMTLIGVEAGLKDDTTYYWMVLAVDAYGAMTRSNLNQSGAEWSFHTNNSNGLPGMIQGYVYDSVSGGVLKGVTVSTNTAGSVTTDNSGYFWLRAPSGSISLSISVNGYTAAGVALLLSSGDIIWQDLNLTPIGGDVNGDNKVNIVDALLIARYAAGLSVSTFNVSASDVNCDGKINIVDALLIARKSAGLAVAGWCVQ